LVQADAVTFQQVDGPFGAPDCEPIGKTVAGLTLGGGLGWLMSKYGLALDNLLSVELVTADGKVRQVSVEAEPDLFWAVRGGGGNFGVATSFEFQLHPVGPTITGGLVAHPMATAIPRGAPT
jgi:FAD/FMN-containing dehydrogenase